MSQYIGTLPVPTADTRLVIKKGVDSSRQPTYELRLGGEWDWNSYVIGVIGKGVRGKSAVSGIATSRIDLWRTPSDVKKGIKTLADFSALTETHFYVDENDTVFIGSEFWAKPIDRATDTYTNATRAEDLTLIC